MEPIVKAPSPADAFKEEISLYVNDRLQQMAKAPAMWGSPSEVQATGFTLLEIYAKHVLGLDITFFDFANFAKKTRSYKGMGNISLEAYLARRYPHADPNWRSKEILILLTLYKESLSLPPESQSP